MRTVEIVMVAAEPEATRMWGEVKERDEPGTPTVAHVEARLLYNDVFHARPGRHVYQFRVDRPSKISIQIKIEGAAVGSPEEVDCTTFTAGQRYRFEVPL